MSSQRIEAVLDVLVAAVYLFDVADEAGAIAEEENGNHTGDKVFDLQESTYWQTEKSASVPHLLVIDLGSVQTVSALEYLPRAEQGAPGSVKNFKIYLY